MTTLKAMDGTLTYTLKLKGHPRDFTPMGLINLAHRQPGPARLCVRRQDGGKSVMELEGGEIVKATRLMVSLVG